MENDKKGVALMAGEANQAEGVGAAPALSQDTLNELVEWLDLLASAKDAMSDELVVRTARAASEGITLLDRLTRNEGVCQLLQVLDRPESQYLLMSLADALGKMTQELARVPPAKGGLLGILQVVREPGTQEGLRAMSMLGKYWNDALRDLHRHGG